MRFKTSEGKNRDLYFSYAKDHLDEITTNEAMKKLPKANFFRKTISHYLRTQLVPNILNVLNITFFRRFAKIHQIVIFLYRMIIQIVK